MKEGSVLCMWTTNYVDYWVICLAAWELGAAVMPVNCLIGLDKLETQLRETETSFIVCDDLNVEDAVTLKTKLEALQTIVLIDKVAT